MSRYLQKEKDYIPWAAANPAFNYLDLALSGSEDYELFQVKYWKSVIEDRPDGISLAKVVMKILANILIFEKKNCSYFTWRTINPIVSKLFQLIAILYLAIYSIAIYVLKSQTCKAKSCTQLTGHEVPSIS